MDNPSFAEEDKEPQDKMDPRRGNMELRNPASHSFNTGLDDLPGDLQVGITKR